jgi:hypothetical protein
LIFLLLLEAVPEEVLVLVATAVAVLVVCYFIHLQP